MMPGQLPLLLFPTPSAAERQTSNPFPPTLHLPPLERQAIRLASRFQSLQDAFDARRLELQTAAPNSDPDLVVVFETVGAVADFISSAERIPGLEWLAGMMGTQVEPDEDFYHVGDAEKPLGGKLFLMGSNRQALSEVVRLWDLQKADVRADLGQGLSAWKQLFTHLKEVRFWGAEDRLDQDLRQLWQQLLAENPQSIRFEVEAWCFSSAAKNQSASNEIHALVAELNGSVIHELLIAEIAYHGFLIEMPAAGAQQLLNNAASLLLSERVMFFRPQGQASVRAGEALSNVPDIATPQSVASGPPIVAMLDGLPLANHPRLQGRLIIDDADDWAADYPVVNRLHGTSMASLIAWGGLDSAGTAIPNPIYVRPILRPTHDQNPSEESTPNNRLLLDLVHAAVRRMFEDGLGVPAAAPTVKVINLSVGDQYRPFSGELSPWARLLDWLSYKYKVLFIVSSGNRADNLILQIPRETLHTMTADQQAIASMQALLREDSHRRLLAPAESVNALTVGACYSDGSVFPGVPGRFALFHENGIAPYSCIGPGFRRAIKPDILLPGGRVLYAERPTSPEAETHVNGVWNTPRAPGHKVAAPPDDSGDTVYTRGTSSAAALATRGAAQAFAVLETLRAGDMNKLPIRYDAVLIKALLAHGASLGDLEQQILSARPEVDHWHAKRRLVSRYAGYGPTDIDRALTCSEQRATMLGVGDLRNKKALEFLVPVPEALNATVLRRRLTVTLAWLTPVNSRHSKYRTARLWVDFPNDPLRLTRLEGESKQLQLGTLQHEIWEGDGAVPIVGGQNLVVRVSCVADAGRLVDAAEFALCVSLEVAEGVELPIYEQVRARVSQQVNIAAAG